MKLAPSTFEATEQLVTEIRRARPSDMNLPIFEEPELPDEAVDKGEVRDRVFGGLFYFLSAITGLVLGQLIWQIAVFMTQPQ